jgi:transcriptional regulator with XRE-family HTH domain
MDKLLFADRLMKAREASGMSRQLMATRIGVTTATVAAWESAAREPRANRLQMIASLLNVPLLWLLGGSQQVPATANSTVDVDRLQQQLSAVNAKMSELGASLEQLNRSLAGDRQA